MSDLVEGFVYKCEGMENGESTDVVQSNNIDAYLNKIVDFIIDSDKDLSLENQYDIIRGNKKSKEIRVDFTYQADKEKINKLANRLSKKYDKKPVNASINGDLKVKKEKSGRVVDTEAIIKKLNEYLSFESEKDIVIEAVTKMVDANIKKEQLKKIKYKMSSFSTSYNPSRPRGRNIALGAKRLNGTLLMPGEKISFLDILYDDSDGKSYKKSAGFWHNKVVLVEGGGICQISTTAYDACLLAGIMPEKRYPHSCPVGYSVLGLDAALSVGGKDLVIKNNRKHPFLIQAKVSGGRLKVSFYSYKNELKGYNYKIRAVKISALKAKSYLDVYKKGKKIKTIYLSTDKYNRAGR